MKQEKMPLTLMPSEIMDKNAQRNNTEHTKIRLSRRARIHYGPSEWERIYLRIFGEEAEKKLRINQAFKEDVLKYGAAKAKQIGFVTTKTYTELMAEKRDASIWVSELGEKITIGADPEFVLVKEDGSALYADELFVINGNEDNKWEQLGSDGPCAEIRPEPSNNHEELIQNIEKLFKEHSEVIKDYGWMGGATYSHPSMDRRYPIGGHIHLGIPNLNMSNVDLSASQIKVVRVLDELVGLPLVRIDTPVPEQRRNALRYGAFGNMRQKYPGRFEWRVPSGIWLVHKDLARAVLGTTKAVAEECWKRLIDRDCAISFITKEDALIDNICTSFKCMPSDKVRALVNNSIRSDVPTDLVRGIHGTLKKMSTYCTYKEEIDNFISICCSDRMPLPNNRLELRYSWLEDKPLY